METPIRLVKVKPNRTPELRNAIFHSWGTRPYLNDNGAHFGVTCAIVEDKVSGQIYLAEPKDVIFITEV